MIWVHNKWVNDTKVEPNVSVLYMIRVTPPYYFVLFFRSFYLQYVHSWLLRVHILQILTFFFKVKLKKFMTFKKFQDWLSYLFSLTNSLCKGSDCSNLNAAKRPAYSLTQGGGDIRCLLWLVDVFAHIQLCNFKSINMPFLYFIGRHLQYCINLNLYFW